VLAPLAGEWQADEQKGHQRIGGCYCPKCNSEA
jgi:hypothetical protein